MKGKKITVKAIAELVKGELRGDGGVEIDGFASLERARPDALSFVGSAKYREAATKARAGALIVYEPLAVAMPQVIVADPYWAFVRVMELFIEQDRPLPGVHPSAVIEPGAELGEGVHVGPVAVVGAGARIGARAMIGAGAVIGAGCEVGADAAIHPRVTLYPGSRVGARSIVHAGTVIGADGFGYVLSAEGHIKKPQVGRVTIEDDVEIGANCAIDRAMLDETVIGAGTKLDNLVHVAHGCVIGQRCIILAGAVFGGGVRVGDGAVISGNVTARDGISIGAGAMVVGHTMLIESVAPGATVFGIPSMPFSHAKRVFGRLKHLPELFNRMRAVEKKLAAKADENNRELVD